MTSRRTIAKRVRVRPLRLSRAAVAVATLLVCVPAAAAQHDAASPERRAHDAMRSGDYALAADAYAALVEARPNDPTARYNLACARSRLGELDGAADSLLDAIARGFVGFFHMERDDDLEPLREHPTYSAVIASWRELLDKRGETDLDAATRDLGPAYRTARDERLRINYVCAFDEEAFAAARREVERVAAFAFENLFPEPNPDDPRPDPWVTVVLTAAEDFVQFVPVPGVGGVYDHGRRTLVARDVGPSLRHEFLHALHHRRMDRIGQAHAFWVQEGLGALVEDFESPGDDERGDSPAPSWRTNMARRLAASGRLTPWRTLFMLESERFLNDRANAHYAQTRAIFMDLASRDSLQSWMRAYEQSFHDDPTGAIAFERTLGAPLEQTQRDHRAWLLTLPEVGDSFRPGAAWLGVVVEEGGGDGVVVREVVSRRGGVGEERLRPRDVVLSVNGDDVRTLDEFERVLTGLTPGRSVRVEVRRGSRRLSFETPVVER